MSRQNCLPLNDKVTSQGPACLGGICNLSACGVTHSAQTSIPPMLTCKPSKKLSPTTTAVYPPDVTPSLGHTALMHGVESTLPPLPLLVPLALLLLLPELFCDICAPPPPKITEDESDGSRRRVRRPCFELLWTNMLSEMASRGPSVEICVLITTWKRRMSRGLPAFFKQFWLHLRKNFRKYLFFYSIKRKGFYDLYLMS